MTINNPNFIKTNIGNKLVKKLLKAQKLTLFIV